MSRRRPRALQPEAPPLAPLPPAPAPLPRGWVVALVLVVLAYIGLGLAHLVVTPVLPSGAGSLINAPDETAHVGYLRVMAEEHRLPTQQDAGVTYEWHQPPLYYALALPFYTGGGAEGQGVQTARLLSVLCGGLALWCIFAAARRLFPREPALAVVAVGLAALLPMRQAVYAAVGNDALLELLFSAALLQIVVAQARGFAPRRAALLGATIGLAILTKATGVLLLPIAAVALFLFWRGGETREATLWGGAWLLVVAVALVSPWYARNWALYHELTPVKAFLYEFEHTARAADFIGQPLGVDLWTGALVPGHAMTRAGYDTLVANWSSRTFCAAYTTLRGAATGRPTFMPPTFYVPYGALVLAALAGLTRLHFRRRTDFTPEQRGLIGLFWLVILLVAVSFVGFVWTFFQAQGRYLYPAMLPLSILGALGLRAALPETYRESGSGLVLLVLFVLALAFLVSAVVPAYS